MTDLSEDTLSTSREDTNKFLAVKKLKETENHIEMLKRRFKILKQKEDEARSKTIQHERQLQAYEDVQRQRQSARKSIQNAEKRHNVEVNNYKEKNKKVKEQMESQIKANRDAIQNEKKDENKSQRQRHFKNEKIYSQMKEQEKQERKKARDKVVESERTQKEKVEKYKESRIMETLANKSKDTSYLMNRMNAREKQLAELAKIEEEMAKRNSESIQYSQAMKSRVVSAMGQNSSGVRAHLPSIHSRHNSHKDMN